MNRNIYKLQLAVEAVSESEKESHTEWVEHYLDVNEVIGFRVDHHETYTDKKDQGIFLYVAGDVFLVKTEAHIMNYLLKEFVDKAVEE